MRSKFQKGESICKNNASYSPPGGKFHNISQYWDQIFRQWVFNHLLYLFPSTSQFTHCIPYHSWPYSFGEDLIKTFLLTFPIINNVLVKLLYEYICISSELKTIDLIMLHSLNTNINSEWTVQLFYLRSLIA